MPAYRTLLFAVDRGVATVTLNRPQQRNAIGDGMREELADAFRTCDGDHSVRVIVLTGTPDLRRTRAGFQCATTTPKRECGHTWRAARRSGRARRRIRRRNLFGAAGLPAPFWCRHRKREPGENPGLSRSGMQERPPSSALARAGLGSDGQ
jgi:Enoyl-CoA hydratase/isomerase